MAEDCLSEVINCFENYQHPIIVEGKKDKESLHSLGAKNVVVLNKPLFAIVESVAAQSSECMILTDFDSEGKQLYGRLKKQLQLHHVKVNDTVRLLLLKETTVKEMEGLAQFFRRRSDHDYSVSRKSINFL